MLLTLLLLIPLGGITLIMTNTQKNASEDNKANLKRVKVIGLSASIINLFVSIRIVLVSIMRKISSLIVYMSNIHHWASDLFAKITQHVKDKLIKWKLIKGTDLNKAKTNEKTNYKGLVKAVFIYVCWFFFVFILAPFFMVNFMMWLFEVNTFIDGYCFCLLGEPNLILNLKVLDFDKVNLFDCSFQFLMLLSLVYFQLIILVTLHLLVGVSLLSKWIYHLIKPYIIKYALMLPKFIQSFIIGLFGSFRHDNMINIKTVFKINPIPHPGVNVFLLSLLLVTIIFTAYLSPSFDIWLNSPFYSCGRLTPGSLILSCAIVIYAIFISFSGNIYILSWSHVRYELFESLFPSTKTMRDVLKGNFFDEINKRYKHIIGDSLINKRSFVTGRLIQMLSIAVVEFRYIAIILGIIITLLALLKSIIDNPLYCTGVMLDSKAHGFIQLLNDWYLSLGLSSFGFLRRFFLLFTYINGPSDFNEIITMSYPINNFNMPPLKIGIEPIDGFSELVHSHVWSGVHNTCHSVWCLYRTYYGTGVDWVDHFARGAVKATAITYTVFGFSMGVLSLNLLQWISAFVVPIIIYNA